MTGGRKKKKEWTEKEEFPQSPGLNSSVSARNLRKCDLGGVIFGCKHHTIKECLSNLIFGLPAKHFPYIKKIDPGLPLFLFNYSDRTMYGIYEAASHGMMNINPYAWTKNDGHATEFPAQVRVRVRRRCLSLSEEQFKNIILENYFDRDDPNLFWHELDKAQTFQLISLFELSPLKRSSFANVSPLGKAFYNVDKRDNGLMMPAAVEACSSAFTIEYVQPPDLARPWASLFKENSSTAGNIVHNDKLSESHPSNSSRPWASLFKKTSSTEGNIVPDDDLSQSNPVASPDRWEGPSYVVPGTGTSHATTFWKERMPNKSEEETYTNEEKCPFTKLKRWADNREQSDLEVDTEDTTFCCESDISQWEDEHYFSAPEDFEDESVNAPDIQSLTNELRQELKEVKAYSREQERKSSALEKKMAALEILLQRLGQRIELLESHLQDPSTNGVEVCNGSYREGCSTEPSGEFSLGVDNLMFIMGGFDGVSWLSSMDCYLPSKDKIKSLKPMNSVRSHAAAAVLDGLIYTYGGWNRYGKTKMWYDTVRCYDPLKNNWISCPPLGKKKAGLAGVSLNNKIYAVGGGNGNCYSEVEMFDPALLRWIYTPPMLQKRFASAAAECNGNLYVVGGYDGKNYLKSAERFDPREGLWSKVQSMKISRGGHSLALFKGKLYSLGGYDGDKYVPTVEVFDPLMNVWLEGEKMKQSRAHFFTPVVGDAIYAFGGEAEGNYMVDSVEIYVPGIGWSVTKLKGIGKRCCFSAVHF